VGSWFLGLLPVRCDVSRVGGGSTDRMLRTTQWTRASLTGTYGVGRKTMFVIASWGAFAGGRVVWVTTIGHVRRRSLSGGRCWTRFLTHVCVSSFEEQTVDALATGAEEGRSNLR
jgi:hypothetical protein